MNILIIENELSYAKYIEKMLSPDDWNITIAQSLIQAKEIILLTQNDQEALVILADIQLSDGNSLNLLQELSSIATLVWVFLTAEGNIEDSVRAMRLGAYNYLEKPFNEQRLELILNNAAKNAKLQQNIAFNINKSKGKHAPERFLGTSQQAIETRNTLIALAKAPFSAVIINGETGTGKGLAAKILHYNSDLYSGAFVDVNCAAIPAELVESELFGHEAGAFTGAKAKHIGFIEQAQGGTLFLDEIGELDLNLQAKLLKAIEEKQIRRVGGEKTISVNFRVIAATHRDLKQAVTEGNFREDLWHRLSVFQLELPALRERVEDIYDLLPNFIQTFNKVSRKKVTEIPEKVWNKLLRYHWPGNVRELRNVVERCVLLASNHIFPEKWLQLTEEKNIASEDETCISFKIDGELCLDEMEKNILIKALALENDNVTAAAKRLGISRQTMRYRIEKYCIKVNNEE